MPTYRRTFPGALEEIPKARHWLRSVLNGTDAVRADDAALIVTELGANALLHTASASATFQVSLTLSDHHLSLTVVDDGGAHTTPRVTCPPDIDTCGRGLFIVDQLADHLEIHEHDTGHTVTAHLHLAPVHRPSPC